MVKLRLAVSPSARGPVVSTPVPPLPGVKFAPLATLTPPLMAPLPVTVPPEVAATPLVVTLPATFSTSLAATETFPSPVRFPAMLSVPALLAMVMPPLWLPPVVRFSVPALVLVIAPFPAKAPLTVRSVTVSRVVGPFTVRAPAKVWGTVLVDQALVLVKRSEVGSELELVSQVAPSTVRPTAGNATPEPNRAAPVPSPRMIIGCVVLTVPLMASTPLVRGVRTRAPKPPMFSAPL
jgi:hypothetical protein